MGYNVDVVIVAFRSEAVIEEAVRRAQALGGQVVVVDHGDGGSAHRANRLGALTLLDPTNPGFGSGQNRGVAATSSPFVLLCNPDAWVEPAAIGQGVDYLAAHPDVAAVQGVIVNSHTGRPERSQGVEVGPLHLMGRAVGARRLLVLPLVRRLAAGSSHLRDHVERIPPHPTEVEALAATAILVRRTAFDEIGGFDPAYFLYGEDMDLCHRLRLRGWKLVAMPDVWASHLNGDSSESSLARELHWWRGTMTFAASWWSGGRWYGAVVAAVLRWSSLAPVHPNAAGAMFSTMVAGPVAGRRKTRR
ncbi:MAG TPA: glycosyltransferase family 2 protein [Acidimicrobiales bacterium]|nr:glycosyltransferase family 2 protein [Acidimicrobiales bacterium]